MGFEGAQTPISPSWRYAYFRISADRFLRNMVRAIVGTLLEVGRGKRSVADFATLILPPPEMPYETASSRSVSGTPPTRPASRESGRQGNLRGLAGDSVPGHALFLSGVEYPFKLSGPPSVQSLS